MSVTLCSWVDMGVEYPQRCKQPVPMFDLAIFSFILMSLSVSCPLPLYCFPGTTENNLGLSSSLPLQVFIHIGEIPPNLPFSKMNSPSSLRFSLYVRCSNDMIIFEAFVGLSPTYPYLSHTEEPRNEHIIPVLHPSVG